MSRSVGRAARLRQIENLLFRNPQGMSAVDIAAVCEVNRRTIYRDINLLEDTGVPIWQDNGRFGIIRDQYLATIRLAFREAVALYIAARLLSRHADEHNPHIVSALHKIATAFPDPLADHINRTADAIEQRPVNARFVTVLEEITTSWAENRKIRIWYRSPRSGSLRERAISPYTVEPSSTGGLYVIGYDDRSDDMRTFKFERIERVARTTERYEIPEDFDVRSHFADAWGIMGGDDTTDVILLFSSQVAPIIQERIWHPSQEIVERSDGSLELHVSIAEPVEMRPWVRSWGADVEVLAPNTLRQSIANDVARLMEIYENDDPK